MARIASMRLEGLPESLQEGKFREAFDQEAIRAANEMAVEAYQALAGASPVVTGKLRQGWQQVAAVKTSEGVEAKVVNSETAASVIEYGARSHFPPVTPPALGPWIRTALGITEPKEARRVAYAISGAIRARGLPSPMNSGRTGIFKRTIQGLDSKLTEVTNSIVENIKRRFNL